MGCMCISDLGKKHKTASKKQNNACQFKSFNKKVPPFQFSGK